MAKIVKLDEAIMSYMDRLKLSHETYDIPTKYKIKFDNCGLDSECDTCVNEFKYTSIKDKNVYKFKTCIHKYCILCIGEWMTPLKDHICTMCNC